ncbi:hypothetical protein CPC08DRAFT_74527 [Agrocybe pediades]|nr:hypothetical protein CPC08DRAFT_74527 [Agrocybe pediades]
MRLDNYTHGTSHLSLSSSAACYADCSPWLGVPHRKEYFRSSRREGQVASNIKVVGGVQHAYVDRHYGYVSPKLAQLGIYFLARRDSVGCPLCIIPVLLRCITSYFNNNPTKENQSVQKSRFSGFERPPRPYLPRLHLYQDTKTRLWTSLSHTPTCTLYPLPSYMPTTTHIHLLPSSDYIESNILFT